MIKIEKELLPPSCGARPPGSIERLVGIEPQRRPNEVDLIIASTDQDGRNTYLELLSCDFSGTVSQRSPLCTLPGYMDIVHCSCNTERDMICFTERIPRRESTSSRSFVVVNHAEEYRSPPGGTSAPAGSASPLREASPQPHQPAATFAAANIAASPPAPGSDVTASSPPAQSPSGAALTGSLPDRSFDGSEDIITVGSSMPIGGAGAEYLRDQRGAMRSQFPAAPAAAPGAAPAFVDPALPQRMPSMSGIPITPQESASPQAAGSSAGTEVYLYKLHVLFCKGNVRRDITTMHMEKDKQQTSTATNYVAGYFIGRPPGSRATHLIRAMDNVQIDILKLSKDGAQRERIEMDSQLALTSIWHHWNPYTRQFTFMIYNRSAYCVRVTDLHEGAEKRQSAFQITTTKFKKVIFVRPFTQPFGMAHATHNTSINLAILRTMYECGTLEDYALCHQTLGTSTDPLKCKRCIFTVIMLRTLKYLDVQVDVDPTVTASDYRVNFLYLHGMIAVVLPGGFVHYVDVSHRERGPTSLFTIQLPAEYPVSNFGVLPTPGFAEWIFVPDTLRIMKVELSRHRVWNCVLKMLQDGGDGNAIKNALHVATSHFPGAKRPTDITASNLQRLLKMNHRFMTHAIITGVILGEAYDTTRATLSKQQNDFWSCIPMQDERSDVSDESSAMIAHGSGDTNKNARFEKQPLFKVTSASQCFQRQEMQNSLQDWFIDSSTVRGDRSGSFFKKIFNSKVKLTTTERFKFSQYAFLAVGVVPRAAPGGPAGDTHDIALAGFRNNVAEHLRNMGVPRDEALKVAGAYCDALQRSVIDLLEVVLGNSTTVGVAQFHVLLNLCIALDVLGFPAPPALVVLMSAKSPNLLARGLFLDCVRSGLFSPSIDDCIASFNMEALVGGGGDALTSAAAAGANANNAGASSRASTAAAGGGERDSVAVRATGASSRGMSISLANFTNGDDPGALRKHRYMTNTATTQASWTAPPVYSGDSLELFFSTNVLSCAKDQHDKKIEAVATFDAPSILQMYRRLLPREWPICHYPPLKLWVRKVEAEEQAERDRKRRGKTNSLMPPFMGGSNPALVEENAKVALELSRRARAAECLAHLYHPFNSTYASKFGAAQ